MSYYNSTDIYNIERYFAVLKKYSKRYSIVKGKIDRINHRVMWLVCDNLHDKKIIVFKNESLKIVENKCKLLEKIWFESTSFEYKLNSINHIVLDPDDDLPPY